MKKKYSTKRALIASVLALCMCFSMLVGTTFAWFTDSVTSANNIIKSGSLEISLEKWNGTSWENTESKPIFNYDKWEPGYSQVVNLKISNLGTLALKWKAVITTEKNLSILADVINVYVRSGKVEADVMVPTDTRLDLDAAVAAGDFTKYTLRQFIGEVESITAGNLKATEADYLGIVLAMDTAAGNEYQNLDLGGKFNLTILATQDTVENDSFDKEYDKLAEFSIVASGNLPVDGSNWYDIPLLNAEDGKVGSAEVFDDSIIDGAKNISVIVIETDRYAGLTVVDDKNVRTFEITATGIKGDNATPIKVQINVGKGLENVKLYHYNDPVADAVYDPFEGTITFTTKTFSPFSMAFDYADADAETPDTPDTPDEELKAVVEDMDQYENVNLEWKSFSSIPALEYGNQLESVYKFYSPHNSLEEAEQSKYANWYCDYYVSMDRYVPANGVILGGNYGGWGWIGFPNFDPVDADFEVPLLGTFLGGESNLSYKDVYSFVTEFLCGVAHTDAALNGATFTVKLVLTNPETNEKYIANEVKYTFDETVMKIAEVSSSTELDEAIADGATSIILGAGEYTMPASAKGKTITFSGNGSTSVKVVDSGASEGDVDYSLDGSNVTFENLTLNIQGSDHPGYARVANATYNNCTIKGANYCLYGNAVFNNCTFDFNGGYVWTWGASYVEFNGCTFEDTTGGVAKAILVHNTTETEVHVKDCTFKATTPATTWDGIPVAAVSIDPENGSPDATVYFEGTNTYDAAFHGLYQLKYAAEVNDVKVFVDGEAVTVPVGENDK